jgi:hypothetical protein
MYLQQKLPSAVATGERGIIVSQRDSDKLGMRRVAPAASTNDSWPRERPWPTHQV